MTASAEMPEALLERIAAFLKLRDEMVPDQDDRTDEERAESAKELAALFAPILADARTTNSESWRQMALDEHQKRLAAEAALRELRMQMLTDEGQNRDGIHSPHNACRYRDQCKALESRALAAEAAVAAERERCAKIADGFGNEAYAACGSSGNFKIDKAEMAQALVAASIAAAIRAGEQMNNEWRRFHDEYGHFGLDRRNPYDHPLIDIRRGEDGEVSTVDPRKLNPAMNVIDLYWRPYRPERRLPPP